jgi:hypothetical protein
MLPAYDRTSALREFDGAAATALLSVAGPDTDNPVIVWTRTPRDGSPGLIHESPKKSDGDVENPRLAPSPG